MYIALEGLKGTGKSTLIDNLLPSLQQICKSKNKTLCCFKPTAPIPNYNQGNSINVDLCSNFERIQLYAERSNYHANLVNWQSDYILSDRSIFTSLAVHWHKYQKDYKSLDDFYFMLRQQEHAIAIPDLVIQLEAPVDVLMKRYKNRNRNYGKAEENIEQARIIASNYEQIKEWLNTACGKNTLQKTVIWHTLDSGINSPSKLQLECLKILNL